MKEKFVKDMKDNKHFDCSLMVMKKLFKDGSNTIVYLGDKTGDIKASIANADKLEVGDVIKIKGVKDDILHVEEFTKPRHFDLDDYLPAISKPLDEIMEEIEKISEEEFKTEEGLALNDYFFKDERFVERFKRGIGGLSQHHNYIGGLAEHTLGVMYMARVMAYRYDCRFKEIAILSAKLHDIGKIIEYSAEGPFNVTTRGELEGHLVIGVTMLEEAFTAGGKIYSEDFKNRVKGCVVQHHGKPEYGSPKSPNSEEAYIVHYADYIDATFNKLGQIKDITEPGKWSDYDRRIGTRLYV